MAEPAGTPKSQKLKVALIPVLGVCLLVVLNRSDSDRTSAPNAATPTAAATPKEPANPTVDKTADAALQRPWPSRSLDEILAFDPFRPRREAPLAAAQPARQHATPEPQHDPRIEHLMSQYAAQTPDLVLRSQRGVSAVIGSQTLTVGDVVEGGARVVEIRDDGIVFELDDQSAR